MVSPPNEAGPPLIKQLYGVYLAYRVSHSIENLYKLSRLQIIPTTRYGPSGASALAGPIEWVGFTFHVINVTAVGQPNTASYLVPSNLLRNSPQPKRPFKSTCTKLLICIVSPIHALFNPPSMLRLFTQDRLCDLLGSVGH